LPRASFEIIPRDPKEALKFYNLLMLDLVHMKEETQDPYIIALRIKMIQNTRANIRSLEKRIKDAK